MTLQGCCGPGQQLCADRQEAASRAAAPCGATRSWDVATLLPPHGCPRNVQPSKIPHHPQSCSSCSPTALGLGQQKAVPRDLPGWNIPLRTGRETHCWPKWQKHLSSGWWARRSCGESWGQWEKDWGGTGQSPAGCAGETVPRSRPQAPSQACGNETKHGGQVQERSQGERLGHCLAPICAEVVRKIYREEGKAFSFWLYNNTLGF